MRSKIGILSVAFFSLMSACASEPYPSAAVVEEEWIPGGPVQPLTLPDGAMIEAVLRLTAEERATGMMYRHFIPPDKGMLFVFQDEIRQPFHMLNTVVPLDMIWMDGAKRIVEMHENAQPCQSRDFRKCESFGGRQASVYVLELAAGQAVAHGLKLGDVLKF